MKTVLGFMIAAFAALSPAFAGSVDEMLKADRAFAAMAERDGVPAAFAAEDVHMFPDGAQPYQGRDTLIERYATWPASADMTWTPAGGMASEAGDFGFTWGRYIFTAVGASGGETVEHGKYLSVWRKDKNGEWKFVADIGNVNPEP